MKERINKLDFIKIKNVCLQKAMSREWEDKLQNKTVIQKFRKNP